MFTDIYIKKGLDAKNLLVFSLTDKEMYIDFNQDDYETVEEYINAIIYDHNYLRPSYAYKL